MNDLNDFFMFFINQTFLFKNQVITGCSHTKEATPFKLML